MAAHPFESSRPQPAPRRPWVKPAVADLPRLTELTLATGPGIPGSGTPQNGGGTVFT
ncbi:MAG TPA: hypothetical protein VF541_16460 [Longimicrobium sp.]|jgi:hypothetical protein